MLRLPLTRRLLTRQREAQIKGYFHRHGFKILVSGRFVPGFRTAAYLTAGILKLPPVKLLLTDLVAASLSTLLMFGLGYRFAYQIQNGIREVQQWVTCWWRSAWRSGCSFATTGRSKRSGLPVGPPVLDTDEDPLSIDDLPSGHATSARVVRPSAARQPSRHPAESEQQADSAAGTAAERIGESAGREPASGHESGSTTVSRSKSRPEPK